jgi:RNA-directed DNA polymerase
VDAHAGKLHGNGGVRRVTQDNGGKNTAGGDGVKAVPQAQRARMVALLRHPDAIKPRPTRRVWIPKPGKTEKRASGIPVMLDRAHQALVKLALEPEWEAWFEPNTYGFRFGRSVHDAIGALFQMLCFKDKVRPRRRYPGVLRQHRALLTAQQTGHLHKVEADHQRLAQGRCTGRRDLATERGSPQGGVAAAHLLPAATLPMAGPDEA